MPSLANAPLIPTINLFVEIGILIGLYIGFIYARKKMFRPHHANIQATMVLLNLVLILTIMIPSFNRFVIQGGTTTGTVGTLMIAHAVIGGITEIVALYLVFSERFKIIPKPWRIQNIKPVMRVVLVAWTITAMLGFAIYYFRYLYAAPQVASPVAPLSYQTDHLVIHADELKSAVDRNSALAVKRHSEHLINLIVGKNSSDFGDLDGNGNIEDPGDGSGMINLVGRVRDESAANATAVQAANEVQQELVKILAASKTVLAATDYPAIQPQLQEIQTLARKIGGGGQGSVPQIAQVLGISTEQQPVTPGQAPGGSITINMKDFAYSPKTMNVKAGTSVTFVNQDNAKHTVTADDGSFNSKDIGAGEVFTFSFDNAGAIRYFCEYHGDKGGVDMAAMLTVTP